MNLRLITSDDVPHVVSIQQRITRSEVSQRWRDVVARHVDNPEKAGFVAEKEGMVVGFIIGEVKVGEFGTELSGWIELLGVAPEHMGTGIGQALGRRMFQHFSDQGVSDLFTAVRWDSGDLLAFFKSLGFDRSPFINLQIKL